MGGPPFDRYPVSSTTIRNQADAVAQSSRPLVAVQNAMDAPRRRAADAVDGELDGQIEGPVDQAQKNAMTSASGAELCGGAIDLYANYVDIFNRAVDDLNERWRSAVAHDFDVPIGDKSDAEHDAEVADARGLLAAELRKEHGEVEDALDRGAEDVARVLNAGPTDGAPLLASYTAMTGITLALGNLFGGSAPLTLEEIQKRYQVGDDSDGMVSWPPWPLSLVEDPVPVTSTEAAILNRLGLLALQDMQGMRKGAFSTADDRFTPEDKNDNHNDAFRHAYWNAMMTRRFGVEWAEEYANAHEGVPGNQAVREAMDLYNNEVGRRIASENPDASDEEIADLIEQAVRDGETVIVGPDLDLVWSNNVVEGGQTGDADEAPEGDPDGNPDIDPDESADPDSHNDHGTGS